MANDAAHVLEFDRVLELLARECQFSLAAERAREIGPSGDRRQVDYLLTITREATALLTDHPGFSVGGVRDIREAVERASVGSLLTPADLRQVLDTVDAARALRRAFFRIDAAGATYPGLSEFAGAVADLAGLSADLTRTVGPRGEILDSASLELETIRRETKSTHRRLIDRVNRLLVTAQQAGVVQDPIVTTRDGRYVIPVRADRRGDVPGVVHGTSASGQTLFIEPMELVDLNNRWRELQLAEEHEIERILRRCTDLIGAEAAALLRTIEAVAALDLALAKARLGFVLRCTEPRMTRETRRASAGGHPALRVDLRQARHPLIDPEKVVPIDIRVGRDYRVLVITGPNTGGKTVALKTLGLLAMMAQSGLFIPAAPDSVLGVFDAIFADIGDEQSIEQSLSTFSSHLTKIVAMLDAAGPESLLLIDEIAAGTDPQEGSALARAIIEALLERDCIAAVTTHYSELKSFAYVTVGTENASTEFDVRTLAPTYRLVIGVPGRSNALAIARRLGLPDAIVERARSYLTPEAERVDELLVEIQRRLDAAEAQRAAATAEREAAASTRRRAEEALRDAERERANARQEALQEMEAELHEAREQIRQARRSAVVGRAAPEEVRQTQAAVREAERQVREVSRRRRPRQAPAERLSPGDRVEVPSLGLEGEITAFSEDGELAEIQAGPFRTWQPLALLRRTAPAPVLSGGPRRITTPPAPRVDPELQLLGMRAADARETLERYLDAAAHASLPWVRIVHGKGGGVLRGVVHDVLHAHPAVDRFEMADAAAGGDGVTIAYLKD